MTDLFLKILNMSISAGWLVLVVVFLRFLLKKSPKWINVLLWGMVAIRLVCPISLESVFSLIPSTETVSPEIMLDPTPEIHSGISSVNSIVNPIIAASFTPQPLTSANPLQIWIPVASCLWSLGIYILLIYTAVSYLRLRRRVSTAVHLRDNIYQTEQIPSPFVLGILRPRIYLPFALSEEDLPHVIAHEQTHIHRRDHWWKPLGFLLLTIHWFNPLMWLAYILLCRDIELACDEKVIKALGRDQRADYSQALLKCSVSRKMITACPLAFGEVGVKQRVKNVLNYKKPAFWVILVSVIICILVAVCFLTDPVAKNTPDIIFHSIQASDVQWTQATFWDQDSSHLSLTDSQIQELVTMLKKLKANDFAQAHKGTSAVSIMIYCGDREILLQWDGNSVTFTFDTNTAALVDDTCWEVTDTDLNRFIQDLSQTVGEPETSQLLTYDGYNCQYVFTKSQDLIPPSLLLMEDGTFQLNFSVYSSYIGRGSYKINGDRLVLNTSDGIFTYVFTIAEKSLIFDAEASSDMLWYSDFTDGSVFDLEPVSDASQTELEDLPSNYSLEQAGIDGCVVIIDNDIREGQSVWNYFLFNASQGQPAFVRILFSGAATEIVDLRFDGNRYFLDAKESTGIPDAEYQYLRHFSGVVTDASVEYDAFERYVLTNDPDASWEELWHSAASSREGDLIAYFVVYSDLIDYPDYPSIPELAGAALTLEGQTLLTFSDADTLNALQALLSHAEAYGYEPKTYDLGPILNLTGTDGSTVSVELGLSDDMIRIDGFFYDYGPGYTYDGAYNGFPDLWAVLGITRWPDAVYQRYYEGQIPISEATAETEAVDSFPDGSIGVWFPDWTYREITGTHPIAILESLSSIQLFPTSEPQPDVTAAEYTLHIAYNSGEEFDLVYIGNDQFFYRVFQTQEVFTFVSPDLREIIDSALNA